MSKRELDNAAIVKTACVLLVGLLIIGYATHRDDNEATSIATEPAQKPTDVDATHETTRPSIKINDRVKIEKPYFSCPLQDDLDQVKKLALIDKDAKAAAVYGLAHGCHIQSAGSVFNVEHMSGWHGSICIRETGDPECAWFPEQLLVKVN